MGLVWSVPLSFKGNDRESPKKGGGETYRRWGVQKRFWGVVFRRIYGMFSTPLSFPPPSAALCWSRVKAWSFPARGYRFGCVCSYVAGHEDAGVVTGHIGTNTPK